MLFLFVVTSVITLVFCSTNFVLIVTDDQDLLLDGVIPMTETVKLIANEGVTFTNAYVNSPICCPSRSTLLTGKYMHNTYVKNNSLSGNCSSIEWQTNDERYSIAALLKNAKDYKTFYAGKYLNQYGSKNCGGTEHVPYGYDWWFGLKGNSKYYNYTISVNGTATKYVDRYLTDLLKEYALIFLNQKLIQSESFFMVLAPPAPHAPFTPAPRHRNTFPNTKAVVTPSFNYTPYNKHWLLQMPPKNLPSDVDILDAIQRHRLQSLLAVDEMIKSVVLKLQEMKILDKTFIIFTSDNGFHIGQFTQPWDKRQPYETDVKVPFFIRGPNVKRKSIVQAPVSMVDITPSILDLAGVEIPAYVDGMSFKNNIINNNVDYDIKESHVLIEYFGEGNQKTIDERCPNFGNANLAECTIENWCKCQDCKNNTYICVRHFGKQKNFKYCQFTDDDNFIEAYDLNVDPYELENIYKQMNAVDVNYYKQLLNKLSNCKGLTCRV